MKTPTFLAAVALTACGSFQTISEERQIAASGFVGCAPKDISTADHETYTWTATCRGRVFYCAVAPQMGCKESVR